MLCDWILHLQSWLLFRESWASFFALLSFVSIRNTSLLNIHTFWMPRFEVLPAVCRFCYSCNAFLLDKIWFGGVFVRLITIQFIQYRNLVPKKESKYAESLCHFSRFVRAEFSRHGRRCQDGTPRHRRRTVRLRMCLEMCSWQRPCAQQILLPRSALVMHTVR